MSYKLKTAYPSLQTRGRGGQGGGYARQNYSNSLNYKFGQMSNSYFWDQLLETTKQLPDGESKLLAYGLNSKNKYEFLFINMDEERRQNEFNNRMILASASNIGYGLSFEGDGEASNGGKGNWLSSAWNSAFVRSYTGDAIFINTSFSLVFLGGGSNATGVTNSKQLTPRYKRGAGGV